MRRGCARITHYCLTRALCIRDNDLGQTETRMAAVKTEALDVGD